MAVSPLGNIVYVNQNMQTSTIQHANAQQRLDFQAMVNLEEMDEKLEEIEAVRPTEESEALDSDREKEKEEFKERKGEENEESPSEESPKEERINARILDIKV